MRERLTDLGVRRLKLPSPERRIDTRYDSVVGGLILQVSYGGAKTWRVLSYRGGRTRSVALGRFPDVSVAEARKRAKAFQLDPVAALKKADAESFAAVVATYLERQVDGRLRTADEVHRTFERYVLPVW